MPPLAKPGPLTDAERFLFDVTGYLVIPDALSPDEVAACLEASRRLHAPSIPLTTDPRQLRPEIHRRAGEARLNKQAHEHTTRADNSPSS